MFIENCKIVTPAGIIPRNIQIEDGKILKIGKSLKVSGESIDAEGRPVIPGLVDVHVHMRDFDQKNKEDLVSGSMAALRGGVTTFLEMPNTSPPVTEKKTFIKRVKLAEKKSLVDFGQYFGITSENLGEIDGVRPSGYKIYLDGGLGEIPDNILEEAILKCNHLAVHAEDSGIIRKNFESAQDSDDFSMHGNIRSPLAEENAVQKVCEIANRLGKPVHICHLSSMGSLGHLNNYTTCEVTPHHLFLTDKELKEWGGPAKTNPPLRTKLDNQELFSALKKGRINFIASDHAPHTVAEKEGSLFQAPSGMPILDFMLRLFLTQVGRGTMSLVELVRFLSYNPSQVFSIKSKGEIVPGKDADLLFLDMKKEGKIDVDEFYSKAKFSPFDGWKTVGDMDTAIVRGEVVFEDGEITGKKGFGKSVNPD